jgi:arabinofuranosyltransferase
MKIGFLRERLPQLLAILTILHLAVAIPLTWDYFIDDAFITFRYAENYAHGHFDYNRNQPTEYRVEGNTSMLWTLVLAPCSWLPVPLPTSARILGLAIFFALAAMAWRVAERVRSGAGPLAAFLVLNSFAFVYFATNGMESLLYALIVLGWCDALARLNDANQKHPALRTALWAVALVLVRPEGSAVALAGIVAAGCVWRGRALRPLCWVASAALATFLTLAIFRWSLYGQWVPNTFYAKRPMPIFSMDFLRSLPERGWVYVRKLFFRPPNGLSSYTRWYNPPAIGPWGGLGLVAMGAIVWRRWSRAKDKSLPLLALVGLMSAAPAVYIYRDVLPLERFSFPFYTVALVFLAAALARCLTASRKGLALVGIVCFAVGYVLWNGYWDGRTADKYRDTFFHSNRHRELGAVLRREFPGTRLMVFHEVGAAPYVSGFDTLDLLGLTDPKAARLFKADQYRELADYALSRRPDLIVLACLHVGEPGHPDSFDFPFYGPLVAHPDFKKHYREALRVPRAEGDGWVVFRRVDDSDNASRR